MRPTDPNRQTRQTRRRFLKRSAGAAAGAGVFQIVQPHVLGGPKHTPPSETFGAMIWGCCAASASIAITVSLKV